MKKITLIFIAICLLPMHIVAQKKPSVFYTVGLHSEVMYKYDSLIMDDDSYMMKESGEKKMLNDSVHSRANPYMGLSSDELERMIRKCEERNKKSIVGDKLSYYTGSSHPLTITNLMLVMDEVGLSNQLFVLAQAVLETGHFSSDVCKNYNNLFGLYDSRNHRYYRFEKWEDSVVGYQKFIQYRYKGGNYLSFLKRIGYAEDPRYTSKVSRIAKDLYKQLF